MGEKGKSMVKSKPIRKTGKAQTARIRNKSFIPVIIQKTFQKCGVDRPDSECDWKWGPGQHGAVVARGYTHG